MNTQKMMAGRFAVLLVGCGLAAFFWLRPTEYCLGFWSTLHAPDIDTRVEWILSSNPLIDGHNDLAVHLRYSYNNQLYGGNFTIPFEQGGLGQHVDLKRLRQGGVGGTFWCAFAFCWTEAEGPSDQYYAQALAETNGQIDTLRRLQSSYPNIFDLSATSRAANAAFDTGKLIAPLCVEGLHMIGNSTASLRNFYALGVRYITMTHNCHNIYADAAMIDLPGGGSAVAKQYWNGVSPAGREIVREMNRLGMMIDLSHVSEDTMRDVLGGSPWKGWSGSLAPVIFSHSCAYALCPHPRNVPDDVLRLVKNQNSLVMVTFAPEFVSCQTPKTPNPNGLPDFVSENSTLAHVVRHIKYIGELIGYDHVGLGSDFDGIFDTPRGLEDVSKFPDLVAAMLEEGISDANVIKIIGGNILRVWNDVDNVSSQLQAEGVFPMEDMLPWLKRPT
ncbi:Renal dipeptidase family [Hyaloscypha variabilis]